jgi:hypothetical protein
MAQSSEPGGSWKPFAIAFAIGALVLTVLPMLQSRFLKAPAPVAQLAQWEAAPLAGGPVSSSALAGHVVLATVEVEGCGDDCQQRQRDFGSAVRHVDDLDGGVVLVTLVGEPAQEGLSTLMTATSEAWRFGSPEPAVLAQLQGALDAFLGGHQVDFSRSHAIVLVDQDNAVRGYWKGDATGRGNSINAARLLAKRGPRP